LLIPHPGQRELWRVQESAQVGKGDFFFSNRSMRRRSYCFENFRGYLVAVSHHQHPFRRIKTRRYDISAACHQAPIPAFGRLNLLAARDIPAPNATRILARACPCWTAPNAAVDLTSQFFPSWALI
jgi:hypothetical protein